MDVSHNRHIATAFAQTFDDVFQVARVFHRWRRDAHDFAANCSQLHRLRDGSLRIHRVARDHRLDPNWIRAADAHVPDSNFASRTSSVTKEISAMFHATANLRERN